MTGASARAAVVPLVEVKQFDALVSVLVGDCLDGMDTLADGSVHTVITSPPYLGLRDYGLAARDWPEVAYRPAWDLEPVTVPAMRCVLGLEPDVQSFIGHLVLVFRSVRRVLRDDGTLWLNLAGSFATGTSAKRPASIEKRGQRKPASWSARNEPTRHSPEGLAAKQLIPTPWRLAMALQADGWFLRSEIVWVKKSPMPESVNDRPTVAHEPLFLLSKSPRYYYDKIGASEPLEHPEAATPDDFARARGRGAAPTCPSRDRAPRSPTAAATSAASRDTSAAVPATIARRACRGPTRRVGATRATCGGSRPSHSRARTPRRSRPNSRAGACAPR